MEKMERPNYVHEMRNSSWEILDRLMDEYSKVNPGNTTAFLEQACRDYPYLIKEASELVKSMSKRSNFLEKPIWDYAEKSLKTFEKDLIKDIEETGRYEVLHCIGEGGMGCVYHARQLIPFQRDVALKALIGQQPSGRFFDAAFRSEAQALARMDHENIARIFDAGITPTGIPYISMEHCPGEPITEFCRKHSLDLRKRILLFAQVCEGVSHAHSKQILHRDLKPSNILVAGTVAHAKVKIIDFGIAISLDTLSESSDKFPVAGTISYMSPEQLKGKDLDVRTDIYSLGALLYELLVGTPPFYSDTFKDLTSQERMAVIKGEIPDAPSIYLMKRVAQNSDIPRSELLVANRLKGELDYITLKALKKDRDLRHSTCGTLLKDLYAYLKGLPIENYRPNGWYFLRKFLCRHWIPVSVFSGSFTILLMMVISLSISLRNEANAKEDALLSRSLTKQRANQLEDALFFMQEILAAPKPEFNPVDTKLRDALNIAYQMVENNPNVSALIKAELYHTLGRSFFAIGDINASQISFSKSVEVRSNYYGPNHEPTLQSKERLATILVAKNAWSDAQKLYEEVIANTCDMELLYQAKRGLGDLHRCQGNLGTALALYEETLAWQGVANKDTLTTLKGMGIVLQDLDHWDKAEPLFFEVYRDLEVKFTSNHLQTLKAYNNWANCLFHLGQIAEAKQIFLESYQIRLSVSGGKHPDTLNSSHNVARSAYALGQYAEALKVIKRTQELRSATLGKEHLDTLKSANLHGMCLYHLGHPEEAISLLSGLLTGPASNLPSGSPVRLSIANNLAEIYNQTSRPRLAINLLSPILPQFSNRQQMQHSSVIRSRCTYGEALLLDGQWENAMYWFKSLDEDAQDLYRGDPYRWFYSGLYGITLLRSGDTSKGKDVLSRFEP